jgi:hypothetical protein
MAKDVIRKNRGLESKIWKFNATDGPTEFSRNAHVDAFQLGSALNQEGSNGKSHGNTPIVAVSGSDEPECGTDQGFASTITPFDAKAPESASFKRTESRFRCVGRHLAAYAPRQVPPPLMSLRLRAILGDHGPVSWVSALGLILCLLLSGCATPQTPFIYDDSGRMGVRITRNAGQVKARWSGLVRAK